MVVIGVTGGIGSGKSIVCEILRLHAIPVYDADKEAKNLNDTSTVIREQLTDIFGDELYVDNKLDRKKLAAHIFGEKENLLAVNKIVHTQLAIHFNDWVKGKSAFPIVAIDAAVIFEAGFQKYVDKTIVVTAPEDIRISRVRKRDNLSVEQIKSRMASQMSEAEKIKLSDFTIINDCKHSIIEQTNIILKTIENP